MKEYKSTLRPLDFSELMAEEAKKEDMLKMATSVAMAGMEKGKEVDVDNLDAKIDSLTSDENISNITTDENGFITPDASVANYDFDLDPRGFDVAPISLGSSIDALSSDANIEAASQNIFDYNPEEEESMGFLDLMKKGKGIFS